MSSSWLTRAYRQLCPFITPKDSLLKPHPLLLLIMKEISYLWPYPHVCSELDFDIPLQTAWFMEPCLAYLSSPSWRTIIPSWFHENTLAILLDHKLTQRISTVHDHELRHVGNTGTSHHSCLSYECIRSTTGHRSNPRSLLCSTPPCITLLCTTLLNYIASNSCAATRRLHTAGRTDR